MKKISFIRKRKEAFVEIKLTPGQVINNREYEILRDGRCDYLLVAEVGKKSIRYNVTEYISVSEYFKSVTSKERFLTAVQYILTGIRESQSMMFELKQFVLDKEYIFVNRQDKRICFVYFPIINEDNKYDVKDFFNSLAFNTIFNQMEDCSYVTQYIQYFKQHMDFSLYDFENFINALKSDMKSAPGALSGTLNSQSGRIGKSTNAAVYTPSFNNKVSTPVAHPSKLLTQPQIQSQKEVNRCPNCNKEVRVTDAFCVMCGQKLENKVIVTPQVQVKPRTGGTTMLGLDNDVKGTTILCEEALVSYPKIIRISTSEQAEISKDDYVIGQTEGNADFCVNGNSAVSREHAHIIRKENKYYIIDYKSTNGTYVDNRKIDKGTPVEITDGMIVRLANEEFKFEL